ncbi:hypothetical protein SFRURICE_011292 [Spodoptera frugiperda]|nr:hypothetical protein SFRURICE_011292 [Spodoptera frugiperda]
MGKPPKKKGGKKNVQKEEEPSQSSVSVEEPTSPDVPEAEVEDDSNLSAAARKRKEKKEKKERSLQALQALQGMKKLSISESKDEPSAKDESTCKEEPTSKEQASKPEPETPTEAPSQTQSEAAAMPSQDKPPPETTKEPPKPAEEEEFGLGLGLSGTRKKKPKKKKAEPAPTAEAQQASAPQTADPLKAAPATSPGAAPVLVQMPEPAHAAAPGPWSKSGSGKSRGWTPVPLGTMPEPPARLVPQPTPVPQATPIPQQPPTAVVPTARAPKSMEPTMCRYQIPNKIPGNRVRAAHIRVMVNYLEMEFKSLKIVMAHKGFPRHQSLLDAMIKDFNLDPTKPLDNQRGCDYFAAFVKGLKVVATLVGNTPSAGHRREFICNGLVGPPHDLVFTITESDGRTRKTSVAEYFAKDKNYRTRSRFDALTRQLNEQQISKMVKEAATPPDERLKKIKEVISNMKYSQNRDFKRFGLEISEKFYTVKAKVLEPPVLEIGNGKVTPRKGQWQANKLLKPEALTSWALIAVDTDSRNDYGPMIDLIVSTGGQLGMAVSKPKFVNVNAKMKMLHSILMNAYRDVRFVFIIVVKQLANVRWAIDAMHSRRHLAAVYNQMTAKNILLKVNSKLMGINQAIDMIAMPKCIKDTAVMIVGADVTHPSPDQSNVPSIAAVTASIDPKCYMYNIELSIQTPKKEMIVEFEDMMFDHLKVYKDRNQGRLPKKIFVFRDGVSEGQFSQKRHHTRLFNDGPNVQYNVEPGTVVDTDIVHSSELDFYLVSHQAIKGTARPTRYHTVCNDGKIPDDEVEQLTYYLCHLYSRCMRSVSYPTPTYYAHLACLRARSLTHGEKFDNRELERKPKRLHVLDKMLQFSRMFFV